MKFYIMPKAWDMIINYARSSYEQFKAEIGGMSIIYRMKDGNWMIDKPCILKQEVSGSNTSLDKDELAKYYTKTHMELEKSNPELTYRFLWWHSHHTMDAFWSGTDLKAIEEYSDGDLGFALVVNLKEEYKFRISMWNPVEMHEDVELIQYGREEVKVPDEINKEVKKLCEKESNITTYTNGVVRRNYSGYNHFVSQQQSSLWAESEEEAHEEMIVNLAAYDQNLQDCMMKLEEIADKYVEGAIKYPTLRKHLKSMKDVCESSELCFTIDIPSKNAIYDKLMFGSGYVNLIKMKGQI